MLAYLGLSLRLTNTGPIIWQGPHLHGKEPCMHGRSWSESRVNQPTAAAACGDQKYCTVSLLV
jgi:hypothetical protein